MAGRRGARARGVHARGREAPGRRAASRRRAGTARFVCGPTAFVEHTTRLLLELGHDAAAVRVERFGGASREDLDAAR